MPDRVALWKRDWAAADAQEGWLVLSFSTPFDIQEMLEKLSDLTAADIFQWRQQMTWGNQQPAPGQEDPDGIVTVAAELEWSLDDGSTLKSYVVAPWSDIFLPNGNINFEDSRVTAWVTWYTEHGSGPADQAITGVVGGKRVKNLLGWQCLLEAANQLAAAVTEAEHYPQDGMDVAPDE